MPKFITQTFFLVLVTCFYVGMGALEDKYYKPRANKFAAKVLDFFLLFIAAFMYCTILEGQHEGQKIRKEAQQIE